MQYQNTIVGICDGKQDLCDKISDWVKVNDKWVGKQLHRNRYIKNGFNVSLIERSHVGKLIHTGTKLDYFMIKYLDCTRYGIKSLKLAKLLPPGVQRQCGVR